MNEKYFVIGGLIVVVNHKLENSHLRGIPVCMMVDRVIQLRNVSCICFFGEIQ